MGLKKTQYIVALIIAIGLPFILADPAFAQTPGGVSNVENFIRSVITVLAGLAMAFSSVSVVISSLLLNTTKLT